MKKILIFSLLFVGLAACATASQGFGPANGSDFGYRSTKLQQDRFRISYTSRDVYESRDFALLRAAQIAEIEGYSHFKVIDGGTYGNGSNNINSQIGFGIGSGRGRRTRTNTHVNLSVNDVVRAFEGNKVTETIEVILINNAKKGNPSVFEAQGVLKSIVPPVVK